MSDTICAAWIQGWFTFAAGLSALGGGALAYCSAVKSAKIQTRLENEKHVSLVSAYRNRIADVADELCKLSFINSVHLDNEPNTIRVELFTIPEELYPKNWRDHAMLGDSAVTAISSLYEMTKNFDAFALEMHGKPAETNSETFGYEHAIDSYRYLNKELRDRADRLLAILKPEGQGGQV
jgi:hypothetical protein